LPAPHLGPKSAASQLLLGFFDEGELLFGGLGHGRRFLRSLLDRCLLATRGALVTAVAASPSIPAGVVPA